ncbi:MAG: glycosyltransferase family 1 protein [Deltaproteobacteria bacterium]|nr:glycosyltransferase family 1 protein [Deltaproteobacteria bacterium]
MCIALPPYPFYSEFGEMLLDVLAHLGFRPTVVQDGDRAVLAADVLLLIGTGLCFTGCAQLLSHWQGQRPTTILWQTEPFPPPTLSPLAERRGLQAVATTQIVRLPAWVLKLLKSVIAPPALIRVREAIRSTFFFRFRQEMITSDPQLALTELAASVWWWPMCQYAWLKQHFPQGWLDFVCTASVSGEQFLTGRDIPARFVPVGYHVRMGIDLAKERDIDVLFIGQLWHPRRKAILDTLQRSLTLKGIKMVIVGDECYGEQRTELLNRARISLNVCHYPWDLPGLRFLMSMGCGALVVSELLSDVIPYEAGKHFVQAEIAALPDTICYYLEHPHECQTMTRAAFQLVTREMTLQKAVAEVMKEVAEDCPGKKGNLNTR